MRSAERAAALAAREAAEARERVIELDREVAAERAARAAAVSFGGGELQMEAPDDDHEDEEDDTHQQRANDARATAAALLALAFHACVFLLLGSYVVFWARMTVLEFLPRLLAVGAATVATGHGALRARAAARRDGGSGGGVSSSKKVA
mgnify:CR=1 FL=1